MAAEQISLRASGREDAESHRTLGTIGMLAAPMLFIEGTFYSFGYGDGPNSRFLPLLGMFYLVGWAASAIGMRQLRATGAGVPGTIVLIIQLAGLSLAFLFNVQEMVSADESSTLFRITDAAWPLSHLFMLVVGILVLTARVWRGWRKLTPILCGLALPVFFFGAGALFGRAAGGVLFGLATATAFMLLGYAVRTGGQTRAGD